MLFAKSPDGVAASAARTARYRALVDEAGAEAGVDPDLVEGMVFLESAGRPDVTASDDVEGAVGLTQILAETGSSLLGMKVDVQESRRLTRRIRRADREGASARSGRLRARRRQVDERFDPRDALAGTGRYLRIAMEEFGRDDLAVVSYHMGIGNLQDVLAAYGDADASYTQVYFDATPNRHPRTYRLLSGLGDDSTTYLWRVLAAREIMRLYREDRAELEPARLTASARPRPRRCSTPRLHGGVREPGDLEDAYEAGDLRPFPHESGRYGLRRDRRMGELAGGSTPSAVSTAACAPRRSRWPSTSRAGVRDVSGTKASLTVTSTVRDQDYQDVLARRNREATRATTRCTPPASRSTCAGATARSGRPWRSSTCSIASSRSI